MSGKKGPESNSEETNPLEELANTLSLDDLPEGGQSRILDHVKDKYRKQLNLPDNDEK